MKQDGYQPRDYRRWVGGPGLVNFTVTVKETDLAISAAENMERKARRIIIKYRTHLEEYIAANPKFQSSLEPLTRPAHAPRIVMTMIEAAQKAGVGPMAAVAGAMAEEVGRDLLAFSPEVIVENGGDIFLAVKRDKTIGLYAGDSPLSERLGLEIKAGETPLGVCTSSGTVGHSLSFGKADAVVVICRSTALADAAATAIGNRVKEAADIDAALKLGQKIAGVLGIVIVIGKDLGAWGGVTLRET